MDGVCERGGTPALTTPSVLMLEIKIPSCTVSSKPITIVDVLWRAWRDLNLAPARARIYHHMTALLAARKAVCNWQLCPRNTAKVFFFQVKNYEHFSTLRLWEVSLKTSSGIWNHRTKVLRPIVQIYRQVMLISWSKYWLSSTASDFVIVCLVIAVALS